MVNTYPFFFLKLKKRASTEQKCRIVREFTDTLCLTLGLEKNL